MHRSRDGVKETAWIGRIVLEAGVSEKRDRDGGSKGRPAGPAGPSRQRRPVVPATPRTAEAVRSPAGAAPRQRRSLSNVGGPSALRGHAREAAQLARWFDVSPEDDGRAHVHGFHAYPARMHPAIVRAVLADMPRARAVLDPFAGSGTTLVEAALAGRAAAGVDINPLAVMLARVKTWAWSAAELDELLAAARAIGERSNLRVRKRVRPDPRIAPAATAEWFAPHVRLELAGLIEELNAAKHGQAINDALRLLLSSILVKVSRQRTDAVVDQMVDKQIGRGMPTRMFVRKAEELVARLAEYVSLVPAGTPPPEPHLGDARKLPFPDGSFDLVITSPPYQGTYDYLEQHALRLTLLGLGHKPGAARGKHQPAPVEVKVPRGADARELGARRRGETPGSTARFEAELGLTLAEMARVLCPGGAALLVMGDSVAAGKPVLADVVVERVAGPAGLKFVAVASQTRPAFGPEERAAFAGTVKREHLILLVR